MIYSIYAAKKSNDNIGHDAHIGGAIAGLLLAILLDHRYALVHWKYVLALLIPIVYYVFTLFSGEKNLLSNFKRLDKENTNFSKRSIDDLYNYSQSKKEAELNELLDKVNKSGIDSLSKYEKERLDHLSEELK